MVRSMTGYGRGEEEFETGSIIVEVRTVNHRFINFSTKLPQEIKPLQNDIEKQVREVIKRGSVNTVISFDYEYRARHSGINREYMSALYNDLTEFASEHGIPGSLDINTLLSVPEAVIETEPESSLEEIGEAVSKALSLALEKCVRMREKEGENLKNDILLKIERAKAAVSEIERAAPKASEEYFEEARKRVEESLGDIDLDEKRWLNELAILAEKKDFSEELARMKSHIKQFEHDIENREEAARKLNFILQELHREANTLGNKSSDIDIINRCMIIKEEVEKIKEQVQNLE